MKLFLTLIAAVMFSVAPLTLTGCEKKEEPAADNAAEQLKDAANAARQAAENAAEDAAAATQPAE